MASCRSSAIRVEPRQVRRGEYCGFESFPIIKEKNKSVKSFSQIFWINGPFSRSDCCLPCHQVRTIVVSNLVFVWFGNSTNVGYPANLISGPSLILTKYFFAGIKLASSPAKIVPAASVVQPQQQQQVQLVSAQQQPQLVVSQQQQQQPQQLVIGQQQLLPKPSGTPVIQQGCYKSRYFDFFIVLDFFLLNMIIT